MRKIVTTLTVLVTLLAASTAYFALQLHIARQELSLARTAAAPAVSSLAASTVVPTPAARNTARVTHSKPELARNRTDEEPPRTETEAEARARSLAYMRAALEDPLEREEMMRASRDGYRRSFPRLAEHLGLTEDQYTRLVDQLAEHQMHWLERRYRCLLDPGCDEMTAMKGIGAERDRELTDILGHEKNQQFKEYLDNQEERRSVMHLRGELPDAARLNDAQSENLIAALGDERRRAQQHWEQLGAAYSSQGTTSGTLIISSTAKTVDERIAEAQEFQRLQRGRAAQILTAAQLQAFRQIQEEGLRQLRQIWDHEEPAGEKPRTEATAN